MKNITIVILLVATIGLGALFLQQRNRLADVQARLTEAVGQLTTAQEQLQQRVEADQKVEFAEKKARALQETLTESSAAAGKQVAKLEESLAAAKTNENKGLAAMFKDPDTREMIKAQQKMVLGPMIDKMYADLFQQLNLTPEQSAQVKDLLLKKMLAGAEMGMSMLDGSADAAKRADMSKQMKTQTDAFDAQIKDALGEDQYKEFQTYEKSMADRMVVGQFRDQIAGSAGPLSASQEKQLIQALTEERANFKWTTDPSRYQSSGGENYGELFNEDRLGKLAAEMEAFDRQFVTRAREILTPAQMQDYEKFLETQRQMRVGSLKLAGKMFGTPGSPPGQ